MQADNRKVLFLGDVTFRRFKPYLNTFNINSVLVGYKYGTELDLADKYYTFLQELSPDEIFSIVRENNVDAVISRVSPAVEETLIRDAMVKEKIEKELQIPVITHPFQASTIMVDKGLTKHFLNANNILTPNGVVITGLKQTLEAANNLVFPSVIKHPTKANSEGVSLVSNINELEAAYKKLGSHRVVLEEYIDGDEVGIEVIGYNGNYQVFPPSFFGSTSFDCNPQKGIRISPYNTNDYTYREISKTALKIAELLKICGIIQIDMIVKDKNVYVIDINGRFGGVSGLSQASTGIDPYKEIIEMSLGKWEQKEVNPNRFGVDIPIKKEYSAKVKQKLILFEQFIDIRGYIGHDILTLSLEKKEELVEFLKQNRIEEYVLSKNLIETI